MNFNDEYSQIQAQGTPYDDLIQSSAAQYGVSYQLLHKQIFMESRFDPNAQSPTGPRGLAQMTKATGRAYGLVSADDFFNPAKSIDAAARHMRDNVKLAGGDELEALLLYNQGNGPVGRPQIDAYDRGDLSGVSEEGLKYMNRMRDVATGSRADALAALAKPVGGPEAPTDANSASGGFYGAPESMRPIPKAGPVDPVDAATGLQGGPGLEVATPFAKLLDDTGADDQAPGLFGKTMVAANAGLQTSPLGMMIRAAIGHGEFDLTESYTRFWDVFNDPFKMGRLSNWTEEDYSKLRASDLDPSYYDVVLRGYRKNFDQNLQLALENQKMLSEQATAGMGAQLFGGAAAMLGDPWTLVNPGRGVAAGLGSRLIGGAAVGGALGGMSEHTNAKVAGREENLLMAILGGAAFGSALNGLLGARPGPVESGPRPLEGEFLGPEGAPDAPKGPGLESGPIEGEYQPVSLLERHLSLPGPEGDISGPATRLMVREKARQAGAEEDPSAMPARPGDVTHEDGPVDFIDVPFEPGAVRTPNGAIHSAGSPLNPRTIRDFDELDPYDTKANMGMRIPGGMSELGLVLGRSTNDYLRLLADDLVRSPTGYTNGSNGKFGATASDLHLRFSSQDNQAYRGFQAIFDEIHSDPFWKLQPMTKAGRQEMSSRRIVEAMERGDAAGLVPGEVKMVNALRAHLGEKLDRLVNPGQFGRLDAQPLLQNTRHTKSYYPNRYSTAAKQGYIREIGRDGLQEAIKRSWLASYMKRPAVKARVDDMLQGELQAQMAKLATKVDPQVEAKALQELVEKYAHDKAYGISHGEQFNRSSMIEENLDGLTGLENNAYLEARQLFDSDVPIQLPNGDDFAVNDLREFDIMRLVPQYDRRTNGDVALMASTGRTTKELKDAAIAIEQAANRDDEKQDVQALYGVLKILTGRARLSPDDALGTFVRSLNDVGFTTKNAYMGIQNFGEAAKLAVNGHLKMLLKDVPILKEWTTAGTKLKPEDISAMHDVLFGKELDDLIRPSRADIVDNLRNRTSGFMATLAGNVKWFTGEAAVRNPFTWLLRESSNLLMDAGRQGMMIDLAHQVLNGRQSKLFTPERLRSASISQEQFQGISDLIRKHFTRDASGKWTLSDKEGLAKDVRSMDLWRLGDRVADEIILRAHKVSAQASVQYGPYLGAVMQFKMFVLRSVNGRMVRGYWEAHRNGARVALDQAAQVGVSVGLATMLYAASAQLKALGLPERARKDYLDRAFSFPMMSYAALSRSSHIGAPAGIASFIGGPLGFDAAAMTRTSILPRESGPKRSEDKPMAGVAPLHTDGVQDFFSNSWDQVPAAGVAANFGMGIYSAAHVISDRRGDDVQGHRTALWNALRFFVPNDPMTQNVMMRMAQDSGVRASR
ncbi:transglycosylase SLT domain-containing protein [Pseudomonas mosselii]|uniref:transglycosylase SLT domain-containing protein n=1 Tax=Pseudomonas mosselii TaxID=78327 RepID=UPI0018D67BA9|nr:transglycosylase SLT domain-containing protein [Pseudomonas mosselii]MBH3312305.1 transglycosylase SLT domain-containing protein [Pseudomonas mosselii]MBH3327326.1 transglycosylase SLT domain-containing protein [Pseudomonas mosselii]